MLLKRLKIDSYSAFYQETILEIDDRVTILTGQNDVGKSAILRLIKLLYSMEGGKEFDANYDRLYYAQTSWEKDQGVNCIATFVVTDNSHRYVPERHKRGIEVDVQFFVTQNHRQDIVYRNKGTAFAPGSRGLHRLPKVIVLDDEQEISSVINSSSANKLEKTLLELAFGDGEAMKLANLSRPAIDRQMRAANKRLNDFFSKFIPHSMGLEFELKEVNESSTAETTFTVGFKDKWGGDTPITLRGRGIRKIMSLMVELMSVEIGEEHVVILIDEPENSLHADSQHLLRRVLEELAGHETIQVIYATHSPSMINTVDPRGLRLLERSTTEDGRATTIINNKPYKDNYLPVRASLGLSPADSMLYASVTVIVEGATEILCVSYLLKRFCDEGIEGFGSIEHLLNVSHFLDGMGDNFAKWCHMARSQGSRPIIFVDGDKYRQLNRKDVLEKIGDAPIVHLEVEQEIENLVSPTVYFEALKEIIGNEQVTLEAYQAWEKDVDLPMKMFTKRVNRWVEDTFSLGLDKPRTLRLALEKAETSEIDRTKLVELAEKIGAELQKL